MDDIENRERNARVFKSPNSTRVIVLMLEGETIVDDFICEDEAEATTVAEKWVKDGKQTSD